MPCNLFIMKPCPPQKTSQTTGSYHYTQACGSTWAFHGRTELDLPSAVEIGWGSEACPEGPRQQGCCSAAVAQQGCPHCARRHQGPPLPAHARRAASGHQERQRVAVRRLQPGQDLRRGPRAHHGQHLQHWWQRAGHLRLCCSRDAVQPQVRLITSLQVAIESCLQSNCAACGSLLKC